MTRITFLLIAIIMSLSPVIAPAAPVHKRPVQRWHGYGFLPGYEQPVNNSIPAYKENPAVLRTAARRNRRNWYIDPVPTYYNWQDDAWHYFGRPGFNGGGRYNGGSFGPCWTRTPIGAVWNCG